MSLKILKSCLHIENGITYSDICFITSQSPYSELKIFKPHLLLEWIQIHSDAEILFLTKQASCRIRLKQSPWVVLTTFKIVFYGYLMLDLVIINDELNK